MWKKKFKNLGGRQLFLFRDMIMNTKHYEKINNVNITFIYTTYSFLQVVENYHAKVEHVLSSAQKNTDYLL